MANKQSNINHANAVEYFKSTGEWFEGCVLHHVNPDWKKNDLERYNLWNPGDLQVMSKSDHMRLHHLGQTLTDETRSKISEALKGKRNAIKAVRCVETGRVYESIKTAGEMTGTNQVGISNVLTGLAFTAGGYHWEYA